jgi:hypothetical protein
VDDGNTIRAAVAKARDVKKTHAASLMGKANVVGVSVGYRERGGKRTDEIALIVMVNKKLSPNALSQKDRIPSEIDGVPIDVQYVGQIKAY